jgi:hypothetical protein
MLRMFAEALRGPGLDISTRGANSGSLPTETESHDPRSGPWAEPVCWLFFGGDLVLLEL